MVARPRPPSLDAGEIQQGIHQLEQPEAVPVRGVYQRALARRRARIPADEHLLQRAEQEGERGAELVAHVGEERGLRPVQLGQRLGALALVLVGLGVDHRPRDLRGDQLQEPAVVVVEQPVGIEPGDEHASAAGLAGG